MRIVPQFSTSGRQAAKKELLLISWYEIAMYSQVQNRSEDLLSSVSTQTGLHSVSIPLLSISTADSERDEAKRTISLNFSMLNSTAAGNGPYGRGWELNGLAKFTTSGKFTLSNNQCFSYSHRKSQENGDKLVVFSDQKTRDFVALFNQEDNYFKVINKDGVVEVLSQNINNTYVLTYLYLPNGHKYTFEYGIVNYEIALYRVTDVFGECVLRLEYSSGVISKADIRSVTGYVSYIFEHMTDGVTSTLTNVKRPTGNGESAMMITYQNLFDYKVVSQIEYEEGMKETISYDSVGHKYMSNDSPKPLRMPRVVEFVRDYGGRSDEMVERYAYPDEDENYANFLGYPHQNNSSVYADTLYTWGNASSYSYWVEVTTCPGTADETTARCTYNTFHLVVSERVSKKDCVTLSEYTYPCDMEENSMLTLEELPDNVLFPVRLSKTFQTLDGTRTFYEEHEVDEFGNTIRTVSPSGIIEELEFYPIGGEVGACPADPFGSFRRYLKKNVTTAAGADSRKEKRYAYIALPPIDGEREIPGVVKLSSLECVQDGQTYCNVDFSFVNEPSNYCTHNSLFQATIQMLDGTRSGTNTTLSFTYKQDENQNRQRSVRVEGYDGNCFSYSEICLPFCDLPISKTDRLGVVTQFEYDRMGNVLSKTVGFGTEYSRTTTYEHQFVQIENSMPSVTEMLHSSSTKRKATFDGAGRLLGVSVSLPAPDQNNRFVEVLSRRYDAYGEKHIETFIDYEENGEEMYRNTFRNTYDGWGELQEVKSADGVVKIFENDPIGMQVTTQDIIRDDEDNVVARRAPVTTQYNLFKEPERIIIRSDADAGEVQKVFEYDGFGRRKSAVSPMGYERLVQEYDYFDRVVSVRNEDGRVFSFEYVAFSPEKLMTSISVSKDSSTIVLGERSFDGIGRMVSRAVNGYQTTYSYNGGQTHADTITTQSGNMCEIVFNSVLGNKPSEIGRYRQALGTTDTITFDYNSRDEVAVGRLRSATSGNTSYDFLYQPSGRLHSVTQTTDMETATKNYIERSISGKPIRTEHEISSGMIQISRQYDEFGRLQALSQGTVRIEMEYDEFGRVKEEIVMENEEQKQVTTSSYDDMDREVERRVSVIVGNSTAMEYTSRQQFDKEDRIILRTTLAAGVEKIVESFEYDRSSRLLRYFVPRCSDESFLVNVSDGLTSSSSGRLIERKWEFDIANNISKVFSTLQGGLTDVGTWQYNAAHSFQVSRIEHTLMSHFPSAVSFQYDDDGNVEEVCMEQSDGNIGLSMEYSPSGRLEQISQVASQGDNTLLKNFKYDPFDRVVKKDDSVLFYSGRHVVCERNASSTSEYVRVEQRTIAEKGDGVTSFLASSENQTPFVMHGSGTARCIVTSPYGKLNDDGVFPLPRTRYTGMLRDFVTTSDGRKFSFYLAGSGTRVCFPNLGMFPSMDTFSPFREGGMNPYAYCERNPTNLTDPTGHISSEADLALNIAGFFLTIGLTVASVVTAGSTAVVAVAVAGGIFGATSSTLGIAADSMAIQDERNPNSSRSDTISKLGVSSSAFGIAAMVTGIAGGVAEQVAATKRTSSWKLGKTRIQMNKAKLGLKDIEKLAPSERRLQMGKWATGYCKMDMDCDKYAKASTTFGALKSEKWSVPKSVLAGAGFDMDKFQGKKSGNALRDIGEATFSSANLGISSLLLAQGVWSAETPEEQADEEDEAQTAVPRGLECLLEQKYP
ncbi:hypothetical protein BWQ96_10177 [Gracilariopsis chorda]|uniref:tRNA(Glu)-specific nuclease WapA n=1 Tax=Gracilariopsis chorda TaxID=448386 RepID=A0A2V3IDG0_9FLOR|nr:hypothetical protein BWQ96_10177 [Gracilariopsis chorda]|eukprot:PXF40116.1 hypothetical protein BWQ96_10177 [Gracilariopsis chorda]